MGILMSYKEAPKTTWFVSKVCIPNLGLQSLGPDKLLTRPREWGLFEQTLTNLADDIDPGQEEVNHLHSDV